MSANPAATAHEAILIAGIARGREQDLSEFYGRYHGRVYAFLMRRLRNPADAAEVANEVMLEVWRGAAHFEGRAKPLTWVLGIAHHKAMDCMRRRGRNAMSAESDPDEIADENGDPVEQIARAQDAKFVQCCLGQLSDLHRAVVHLAFFEDLGYAEIAVILACPEGTVKTRMFHAKQGLKRCLGRIGPAEQGDGR